MTHFPELALDGAKFVDDRGWLQVLYESDTAVLKRSFSKKGVFRGLHMQRAPALQTKLIRVIEGRILDIIADPDGGAIHHREIAAVDDWILITSDVAHGFYALEDSLFEYVCDGGYDEGAEISRSILSYLIDVVGLPPPLLSSKDRAAPPLALEKGE